MGFCSGNMGYGNITTNKQMIDKTGQTKDEIREEALEYGIEWTQSELIGHIIHAVERDDMGIAIGWAKRCGKDHIRTFLEHRNPKILSITATELLEILKPGKEK